MAAYGVYVSRTLNIYFTKADLVLLLASGKKTVPIHVPNPALDCGQVTIQLSIASQLALRRIYSEETEAIESAKEIMRRNRPAPKKRGPKPKVKNGT